MLIPPADAGGTDCGLTVPRLQPWNACSANQPDLSSRHICLIGIIRLTYVTSMNAPNPNFADEVAASFAQQSIMELIGASLTLIEPGIIEITLPYRQDLTQQNGYLHAGIVTTIADSACGYAAFSLMPEGSGVLSVEFKVNLLRPAKGEEFQARAEVIKAGKTLTVVRADVFAMTENERSLVATMQGTMMRVVSEARPSGRAREKYN